MEAHLDGGPATIKLVRPRMQKAFVVCSGAAYVLIILLVSQSDEMDAKIESAELETLEYDKRWGRYRLRLTKDDIKSKAAFLKDLSRTAYERRYAG